MQVGVDQGEDCDVRVGRHCLHLSHASLWFMLVSLYILRASCRRKEHVISAGTDGFGLTSRPRTTWVLRCVWREPRYSSSCLLPELEARQLST